MLQDKIKEIFAKNKDFVLASSLLLFTNTIDKIVTFNGVKEGTHYEINLIQNSMIEDYGITPVMVFSALFPFLLIPLSKKIDDDIKESGLEKLKMDSVLLYSSGLLSIYSTIYTVYNYFKF